MPDAAPTLNPVLHPFWTAPARGRVLYGGRMSSKTWDAAGMAVYLASNYYGRFLCTRQFQNRIDDSVYSVIRGQIMRFGLACEFRLLKNRIIHRHTGSEFLFYGLWRHIDEIKALEGIDVCWIEEAHNLLAEQWRILRDTVYRKQGAQFWIIFNPRYSTDFVWRRFVRKPPHGFIVRKINYDENPFLTAGALANIQEVRTEDPEEYEHVFRGVPKDDSREAIIRRLWVMRAIGAAEALGLEPAGERRAAYDVADSGNDANVVMSCHGPELLTCESWHAGEDELDQSAARARRFAVEQDARVLVYDSIGVGAHVGSKVKAHNEAAGGEGPVPIKFNAGGPVLWPKKQYKHGVPHRDAWRDAKAQAWGLLADKLRHTAAAVEGKVEPNPDELVSIHPDMPELETLVDELATPEKRYTTAGQLFVEPKRELAKRGIESHNHADAAVMLHAPRDRKATAGGPRVRRL